MEPMDLLKLLLDPARLAVAGALAAAEEPRPASALAHAAGTDERTTLLVLAALLDAGLAQRHDGSYVLDQAGWHAFAEQVAVPPTPMDPRIGLGMTRAEQEVLAGCFEGTTLREIPRKRSRRLVVLERLALEFEPGRHFSEREVNDALGVFHPDTASLRRHLVDEGLLDRGENRYWRSGGRVV